MTSLIYVSNRQTVQEQCTYILAIIERHLKCSTGVWHSAVIHVLQKPPQLI